MKRHEQLIAQDKRNTRRIEKALRDAVRELTGEQLEVFIEYMRTIKSRTGYITCTPMKMRCQLGRISNVSISGLNLGFVFRGSYGDALRMALPIVFLDNAKGRQAAVAGLQRQLDERADILTQRDIRELRALAKRYPKITKEVSEKQLT